MAGSEWGASWQQADAKREQAEKNVETAQTTHDDAKRELELAQKKYDDAKSALDAAKDALTAAGGDVSVLV